MSATTVLSVGTSPVPTNLRDRDAADLQLDDLLSRRVPAGGTGHVRTQRLCEHLGLDATAVPTIHVTGTRGKTSTAWMVDALLRAAGWSTARFTSPHLHCPGERLVVDGVALPVADLARRWHRLRPRIAGFDLAGSPPGFFDLATTLFVELVDEVRPDVAVVEVGRGGRDDATNVFAADVAVFTPIGGDHPDLGPTPLALAHAKFGIATHGGRRPAGPRLVTATQVPAVAGFLAAAAAARGWPLRRIGDRAVRTDVGGPRLCVSAGGASVAEVPLADRGPHHARNAALAVGAVEAFLGHPLDVATVRAALSDLGVPGRLERRWVQGVAVRHDGAHDPLAAAAVRLALPERRRVLVVGTAAGKDVDGVVAALAPACDEVVATTVPSPGATPADRVADAARRAGLDVRVVADPDRALDVALARAGHRGEVLVTGSLHLVGHLRRR